MGTIGTYRPFCTIMAVVVSPLFCIAICFGQSSWEWSNPLPQGYQLNSVTYCGDRFVAVGNSGTILESSDDGATWTSVECGRRDDLKSVVYADTQIIAVGSHGTILQSLDGTTWTLMSTDSAYNLNSVIYVDDLFIAAGSKTILTSWDGATWEVKYFGGRDELHSVAYGNGLFVALGFSGVAAISTDGSHWKEKVVADEITDFTSVTYGRDKFVGVGCGGRILFSPDGATWSETPVEDMQRCYSFVTYINDRFVAIGNRGMISTSPDGESWTTNGSGTASWLCSMACNDNHYVIVGESGLIQTSPDGTTWKSNSPNTSSALYSATYANDHFVVIGNNGTILTSPDARTWTLSYSDTTPGLSLKSVTYGNGRFVAVGGKNFTEILSSVDAATWEIKYSDTIQWLNSVTFGDSQFVAAGKGRILTSADADNWTIHRFDPIVVQSRHIIGGLGEYTYYFDFKSVAYGENLFIAADKGGSIWSSPDGSEWTQRHPIDTIGKLGLTTVIYAGNQFVAAAYTTTDGLSSGILSSQDGSSWVSRSFDIRANWPSIAYGDSQFVIVGLGSPIYFSSDAVQWQAADGGKPYYLHSVTHINDCFMAVGNGGNILVSKKDAVSGKSQTISNNAGINRMTVNYINECFTIKYPIGSLTGSIKVGIFSIAGKKILSSMVKATAGFLRIPAQGFSAGTYILSITDSADRLFSSSFIIKR